MKKMIQLKLKILAQMILVKYKPRVIGITGSIGKTSAKEAVFAVVSSKFKTRASQKNYNNEIGVPLTIIGSLSAGRSIFGWLKVFFKAAKIILFKDKNYPEVLVLEMGIDRPGDMDYLTSIVKCDVGIITMIGQSHMEYFGSLGKIKKEKVKLIENLKPGGLAVLNFDNKETKDLAILAKGKVISYGLKNKSDVRAENIYIENKDFTKGSKGDIKINFEAVYKENKTKASLTGCFGEAAVSSALAGISAGLAIGISLDEACVAVSAFRMPPGRMNLIPGIKHTLIIDDTYNSSPQSVISTLNSIKTIELEDGAFRFAVLGDMLELGSYTEEGHELVGSKLLEADIDVLIAVGERSRDIIRGAKKVGMRDEFIFHFGESESAGRFVQERIKKGDLIFVKGSQGVRMEKIVKEIMADPLRADELLVRQGDDWK